MSIVPLHRPRASGVVKSKLCEALLPSVSVTVMVAVCTPGAKSKTLMLSTSWPAWGWNITTMFDVSLYRFKHRVDYNTVTSLLQDRKLTWYSGCTINRAHKCVLWTITDDNHTGIWIDRHLRIRRNITLDVNWLRCCISKNRNDYNDACAFLYIPSWDIYWVHRRWMTRWIISLWQWLEQYLWPEAILQFVPQDYIVSQLSKST